MKGKSLSVSEQGRSIKSKSLGIGLAKLEQAGEAMGITELFCRLSPVAATMFVSDVGVSPSSRLSAKKKVPSAVSSRKATFLSL